MRRGMHVLYSTGGKNVYYAFQPAVAALAGDYDQNGVVDAADYIVWRKVLGSSVPASGSSADGDADGHITQADYDIWRANFGRSSLTGAAASLAAGGSFESVPEPNGAALAIAALTIATLCTGRNPKKVGARSGVD